MFDPESQFMFEVIEILSSNLTSSKLSSRDVGDS